MGASLLAAVIFCFVLVEPDAAGDGILEGDGIGFLIGGPSALFIWQVRQSHSDAWRH